MRRTVLRGMWRRMRLPGLGWTDTRNSFASDFGFMLGSCTPRSVFSRRAMYKHNGVIMRIAVVTVPASGGTALKAAAEAMVRAFEAAGHRAEILDPPAGISRLPAFEYFVLGTEATGFRGVLPPRVSELLAGAPGVQGKRSFAFVLKKVFGSARALRNLMAAMEAEGLRVTCGEIVNGPAEAGAAARAAPVERIPPERG